MAIPIISDIIDGIKWFIDFFMSKVPRSLQFFIFLVLILLFSTLIPYFLQIVGIHCDTEKQVHTIGAFSFFKNYDILTTKNDIVTGNVLNFSDVHPNTNPDTCYFYMKQLESGKFEECIINSTDTTGCYYYYKDAISYDCYRKQACFSFLGICTWYDVCQGDAFPLDQTSFDLNQRPQIPFSEELGLPSLNCYIPYGYAWSWVDGYYFCANSTLCGNGTGGYKIIDEKLEQAGAIPVFTDKNENSYKNLVRIKCDSNLNPILTLYGIPVFDYQLWIIGTLIFALGYFLVRLSK